MGLGTVILTSAFVLFAPTRDNEPSNVITEKDYLHKVHAYVHSAHAHKTGK
jgi:hypothetical protein